MMHRAFRQSPVGSPGRSARHPTKQVHVGSRGYPNNLYAFEVKKWLPQFAMYSQVRGGGGASGLRTASFSFFRPGLFCFDSWWWTLL